jgi:hypothetical protein
LLIDALSGGKSRSTAVRLDRSRAVNRCLGAGELTR